MRAPTCDGPIRALRATAVPAAMPWACRSSSNCTETAVISTAAVVKVTARTRSPGRRAGAAGRASVAAATAGTASARACRGRAQAKSGATTATERAA
ncbi:hypothetical protein IFDJLNFL_5786 [Methylobacterium dankookense]|uniref:Uncharacterized protein n=1 Tax=Methylobacterium dankookense TaxID=560405 RepID=A0ABQ4RRN3_9HYPH|nr:hypothetical protein IFDJLNFL_5786 [Methylobacterium dankookense]